MQIISERLQEWAESKRATMIAWSKEFDSICKEEGITENPMVSMAIDRNYASSIHSIKDTYADVYYLNTEPWFKQEVKMKQIKVKKNNKWVKKWVLETSDWIGLCLCMATVDYIVWQILRG